MGLALDYGSDDSDQEEQSPAPAPPPANPAATTSALGLPPPKNKKRALKIGFDHPLLSAPTFGTAQDEAEADEPASKKARRIKEDESSQVADKTGKGKSTLLDMLPPPKRAVVPSTITTTQTSTPAVEEETEEPTLIMPRKVAKQAVGKPESVGLDLFGLASTTPSLSAPISHASESTSSSQISSAPIIEEYIPPPPSAQDPYPGYYQDPKGTWHAYPAETWAAFLASSAATLAEQGAVGRAWEGVEDAEGVHVDVKSRMEEERRKAEELKKLTARASEETTYRAVGKTMGRAGQRHQLSTLLKDAQANRVALEERFARDKRTKKESGGKYGF
ncbi:hypothetical protein NCC49_004445 [Naganishia albida]|nr:hypothetical protein NCC49_004445 [Naganishia albida]